MLRSSGGATHANVSGTTTVRQNGVMGGRILPTQNKTTHLINSSRVGGAGHGQG